MDENDEEGCTDEVEEGDPNGARGWEETPCWIIWRTSERHAEYPAEYARYKHKESQLDDVI